MTHMTRYARIAAALGAALSCFLAAPGAADIANLQATVSPRPATELEVLNLRVLFDTFQDETATTTATFRGQDLPLTCTSIDSGGRRLYDCSASTVPDALLLLPPGQYSLMLQVESRRTDTGERTDLETQTLPVEIVVPDIATLSQVVSRMSVVRPQLVARQMVRPLQAKLRAAQAALDRGQRGRRTAQNNLRAFRNQVRAQAGRKIDRRAAVKLTADADALSRQL